MKNVWRVSGDCLECLRVSKGITEWYIGCQDASEGYVRTGHMSGQDRSSRQVKSRQSKSGQVQSELELSIYEGVIVNYA